MKNLEINPTVSNEYVTILNVINNKRTNAVFK